MGHYEIGAHFGTSKKGRGKFVLCEFFFLHGKTFNLELR